jgi:hypothetical protein
MKKGQKIIKVHLEQTAKDEYSLLGLVTTEPDYRLSLALNKKISLSLKNNSPIEFTDDKGEHLSFSRFSDLNGAPEIVYNLISNKSDQTKLLKKFRNIDYFLQVHDTEGIKDINLLANNLREIDRITAVFKIDISKIKEKNIHYLTS